MSHPIKRPNSIGNDRRKGKGKYGVVGEDGYCVKTRQMRAPEALIPDLKLLMAALHRQDPEVLAIVERLKLNNQNREVS